MFEGQLMRSQFLALVPYLGLKSLDWGKTVWPVVLTDLETRTAVGVANFVPRPALCDEDCVQVSVARDIIMRRFAKAVAECRELDEVPRWIKVTDYGKYGTLGLVAYVLRHLDEWIVMQGGRNEVHRDLSR